jgi:hypothetical protein
MSKLEQIKMRIFKIFFEKVREKHFKHTIIIENILRRNKSTSFIQKDLRTKKVEFNILDKSNNNIVERLHCAKRRNKVRVNAGWKTAPKP